MHLYHGTTQQFIADATQARLAQNGKSDPDDAGQLEPDVKVGDWAMPWNTRDGVGRIVGPDLVYRPMDGGWVGQGDQSHDHVVRRGVTEAEFTRFVKSTYRVLLTRGLRGCYFTDAPMPDFFVTRTERDEGSIRAPAEILVGFHADEPPR